MGELATIETASSLSVLVDRASQQLAGARSSAEVLDARDMAGFAYDQAKSVARIARAKGAHDELVAAAHRAQADALEIEAQAKRRLADEYDSAQQRGEVAGHGGGRNFKVPDGNVEPTAADIGLTRKQVHEARQIRDAEVESPGIVRRILDERLKRGEEPTKAAVRQAVAEVLQPPAEPAADNVLHLGQRLTVMPTEGEIQRDLLAEEAGEDRAEAEEFDHSRIDHRARAINGALNTFDHVQLSGREYWQVYGKSPSRETFIAWVRAAKATIDDILKEYDHVRESSAKGGRAAKGSARASGQ